MSLADLDEATASRMFTVARLVAAALRRSTLRSDGINLLYADGKAAFQEVFHSHLHVFPRFPGDGFTIGANWERAVPREDLDRHAAAIRDAMFYEEVISGRRDVSE